jgi:hypothetical protein
LIFSAGLFFNAKAQGRKGAKAQRRKGKPDFYHPATLRWKISCRIQRKIAGGMGWLIILKTQIIRG